MANKKTVSILTIIIFSIMLFLFADDAMAMNISEDVLMGYATEELESESASENQEALTSTLNIRCYVDPDIMQYNETILFTLYNQTKNETQSFQLESVNDYFNNINIAAGHYFIYATIANNDGTYSLYCPQQEFSVERGSINLICAYGKQEYINNLKKSWGDLKVYEQTDVNAIQNMSTETNSIYKESETEAVITKTTETETIIPVNINEEKTDSKKQHINIYGIILLIIMIIYIIYSLYKKKRR